MARLNEPPAPMESNLDILRRKFLRQNRDLARVNSNQSNRIRILENEYARLLSDNLDLRGQVMRLQKELENDTTRRVADQAIELKARMEAKLAELGSMLATFGDEPPAKRHSPERKKYINASPRSIRKTAQRKPRENVDQDALAAQEGRLPPIYENKSVARATMNSAEIMALCAEAADTSYSPDIGPPPVLRSVDENTAERSSPVKPPDRADFRKRSEDGRLQPESMAALPKLDYQGKTPSNPEPTKELAAAPIRIVKPEKGTETEQPAAPTTTISTLRAGAKRKYGDENETTKPVKAQSDKPQPDKENEVVDVGNKKAPDSKGRVIKDVSSRKEPKPSNNAARPALSAKSANEDVSTPRKAPRDQIKSAKAAKTSQTLDNIIAREREKKQLPAPMSAPVLELAIPPPPPEPPIAVTAVLPDSLFDLDPEPDQEPEASAPPLTTPDTPDRPAPQEAPADTPPPGYLALNGETARPSRRARSAVSYAEPNLRDKMRRPTKELFDAVAGEGRFKQRTSINVPGLGLCGGTGSAPASTVKPISESTETPRETVAPSPSAPRQPAIETTAFPNGISTERRKRPSVIGNTQDQQAPTAINFHSIPHAPPPKPRPAPAMAPTKPTAADDVYDFSNTSPGPTAAASTSEPKEFAAKPRRQQLRRASAAAAHQALRDYAAADDEDGQSVKQSASSRGQARKRASMLAPKKTPLAEMMMLEAAGEGGGDASMASSFSSFEEGGEASGNGDGEEETSQRERDRRKRVDRRRSMML
ncbi:hypothetical protein B0T18DRAFT_491487 [Schizothecium vesticola]|uniref:Shugoshin n=1 Tax=Schizothecium vesticola TaxID=314040 RepID=A0AA40K037_9PEZI|nr:hypothetical protein B0T18DRAFT_491487 [Schizothecium vesticola]